MRLVPESHRFNASSIGEANYEQILGQIMANMDDMFLALMGSIILLMQAGFAFLEAGSVRAKNTTNILIKNFADLCFGSLAFWLVGFAFAFGDGNSVIGLTHFAAINLPESRYTYMFFQCTFAATSATIVSGAIAERCHFNGYIIFSCIITGILYPIATHWCWAEGGWLAELGFVDFAGSGVVHMSGGVSALVGAFMLGPRIDRFKNKTSEYINGHSTPLVALGGFILVMGFMAFNAGSQGSISQYGDGEVVGRAVMSTLISCGTGGAMVLFLYKFLGGGTWSLTKIINGCLAGMVSVAGGCDGYYPWSAFIVSALSSPLHLTISRVMVKLRIDDPVDAVAVHFGSGPLNHILMTNQSIGRQDSLVNNEHKSHRPTRLESTCLEENLIHSYHFSSGEPDGGGEKKKNPPISVLDHGQITQSKPMEEWFSGKEHPPIMANGKKISPVMIKVA
eukprot:TCALIF_08163-PA protein Name:"Similar to amt-1 Putative ammonium transporter 1 (Caenorhabditis elegans)" AED:0.13 eAED:0.21 QI:0/0.33/0.14/0.85/1/1/7/0/450